MLRQLVWTIASCVSVGAFPLARSSGTDVPARADFFEQRVRPVLVERCIRCHGPDKQKGGLRLDSSSALRKGSDNGPVITPTDLDNSPLLRAIRYESSPKMPPGEKLPPAAIEALTTWVKNDAPWPETPLVHSPQETWKHHWAFQRASKPSLPAVRDTRWPQTSIDRFILARLEAKGITPSRPADRRTLIRRVTFDLLGLPPTPAELGAFEADPAPDAYARLIDRLLASPHYGERWGRHWLDVARYADTKGYVFFEEREYPWAYTYRDYVIRAFNDDLPYDQLILQQLAADLLVHSEADRRTLPALGFLTVGSRFMNNMQDILDDRIDVTTRGLLGLTVTCARCHDHKFDPIPTADYYSLYGVFASCTEPNVLPLFEPSPATSAYAAFAKELQAREQKLSDFLGFKRRELVESTRRRIAEYLMAAHALSAHPTTDEFMLLADGGDLNPTIVIRWKAYLDRAQRTHDPVFAPWCALAAIPQMEFTAQARPLIGQLVSKPNPGAYVNPQLMKTLSNRPPQTLADAARQYGVLLNGVGQPSEPELRQVFEGPDSPINLQTRPLTDLELLPDRPAQAKLQELRKAVETWRATGAGAPPRAMVVADAPTPYQPHVFRRGNPNNLGPLVPRQFLSVLAGSERRPFQHGSGRLELARAIVARDNPLTARVLVNRLWAHHFGAGLVRTPSDFGLRSEPPSHLELLDYLASIFMEEGWSIKRIHRLILLSAVYQQQSGDRPECRAVDPENALLWKMNRRRLDFETTRDALLAVAGTLDQDMGGPAIREITAPSAPRRTIYGFLDRLNVPGLYRTFDFPSPDASNPQRDTTTVVPQALFLMNNPFVIEQARRLAARGEIQKERDPASRVTQLYQLVYSRCPTPEEQHWLTQYVASIEDSTVAWQRCAQALLLSNEFVFID
jgi:hypothetical protein